MAKVLSIIGKIKKSPPNHGEKSGAALVSIVSNTILVILKLVAGFMTGSVAILSEAVHSGMDLLAALMAYASVKVADTPPDDRHQYGHGKAENLAALFEGALIVIAGFMIIWQSVRGFLAPEPLPGLGMGAIVMLVSAVTNIWVSRYLFKVGERLESAALVADAWHLRTDVYTSLGVFVALGGIILGTYFFPGHDLAFLDPLCAFVVALMILKAGCVLTWEAVSQLLDQSLTQDEMTLIIRHIEAYGPLINGYGDIQTRRSGSCRIVYMELQVDGSMELRQAHDLGEKLADSIRKHFPNSQITFHLEPQTRPTP